MKLLHAYHEILKYRQHYGRRVFLFNINEYRSYQKTKQMLGISSFARNLSCKLRGCEVIMDAKFKFLAFVSVICFRERGYIWDKPSF